MEYPRITIVPIELSDGTTALAEVRAGDREEDVSWTSLDAGDITASITALVRDLAEPLASGSANEVTLEFGVALAASSGKLTSMLLAGSATASIKVTMVWRAGTAT